MQPPRTDGSARTKLPHAIGRRAVSPLVNFALCGCTPRIRSGTDSFKRSNAFRALGCCAAGGAGLRVCERFSRHSERGRHGDLHALDGAALAVVWSGAWNFIGVLVSSGAVAFGIVSLLRASRNCPRLTRR